MTVVPLKVTKKKMRQQITVIALLGTAIISLVAWRTIQELRNRKERGKWPKIAYASAKRSDIAYAKGAPVNPGKPKVPKKPPAPAIVVDPEALGALKLEPNDIPAETEWPVSVHLPEPPPIETAMGEGMQRFVYRSPHYEFQSDTKLGPDVVREFARVFEVTHMAVCKLPLDFRPAPEPLRGKFTALLFEDEEKYLAAGGMAGSAGCYKRGEKAIFVPLNSLGVKVLDGGRTLLDRGGTANSTLIHEITHQMMNRWLPRLPVWFAEGAAEYMVVPEYLHGRFNFNQLDAQLRRYLQRRGSRDGKSYAMLKPGELMGLDRERWAQMMANASGEVKQNYVSAVLLTFYFYHLDAKGEGATAYLRALEKGELEIDACRDHLVRGRSVETIEKEIGRAFGEIGITITFTSRNGPVWKPIEPADDNDRKGESADEAGGEETTQGETRKPS